MYNNIYLTTLQIFITIKKIFNLVSVLYMSSSAVINFFELLKMCVNKYLNLN